MYFVSLAVDKGYLVFVTEPCMLRWELSERVARLSLNYPRLVNNLLKSQTLIYARNYLQICHNFQVSSVLAGVQFYSLT